MASQPQFIDIGVNLTDPVFRGSYHGKQAHQDDLYNVLSRSTSAGVVAQILTGGNLAESHEALSLAQQYPGFYSTAGCHPTRTSEMEAYADGAEVYLQKIKEVILDSRKAPEAAKVVAVGECGLDYDRLHFSPADVQKKHFATQLTLAAEVRLPLFLHSRAAHADFVEILKPKISDIHSALSSQDKGEHKDDKDAKRVGVVHSFTGSIDQVKELLDLGLFIGINGCSLKTQENLDVLQHIPLSRLMLETDAPWCDPRSTHASHSHIQSFKSQHSDLHALYQPPSVKKEKWKPDAMVKGRNEPCVIGLVAATVASVKGVPIGEVAEAAMYNTRWLFRLS
ncbi:related to 3'--_5' exonuclease and endonuclease [Ustilago trichophora]|uniref:Related to 3'-->5' exonuclease and endonuclease n=1 Tax=Ustilago trichophora TaxID=86804 RepID=A0A5C3EI03_9BASI|nr:related to 3'-->5' exonuclease and endonuclease [Ustilago trichophora]